MPLVKRVAGDAKLLDPTSAVWRESEAVKLRLIPAPVVIQPSEYIYATVSQRDIGAVKELKARALHDGASIYYRLEWPDPTEDSKVDDADRFADGAAIMFPFGNDAPLVTMGWAEQPVNQWHWRADLARPYNVTSAGLGTTYRTPESFIEATARREAGRWALVLARSLQTPDPDNHVQFPPGSAIKAAFCIWEGGNRERAGLKSYSPRWIEFTLEA